MLDVGAGNRSILLSDKPMPPIRKWQENVQIKELVPEIIKEKKILKKHELTNNYEISQKEAEDYIATFFDERQIKIEEIMAEEAFGEMALNFLEYYEYLMKEKNEIEEEKKRKESFGGIIEPAIDERGPRTEDGGGGTTPSRVGEINSFEERDKMLKGLNPERIIKFDSIDENGNIVQRAYTCYIYPQPQKNDGYLIISEPFEGNKSTRAFFVTKKDVDEFHYEGEEIKEFWEQFVRIYIEEMTGTEFRDEPNTYVFNHTTDLETYKQKIEGVVKGVDKNSSQYVSSVRASKELYGKARLLEGIRGVITAKGLEEARNALGDLTNEKGGTTNGK